MLRALTCWSRTYLTAHVGRSCCFNCCCRCCYHFCCHCCCRCCCCCCCHSCCWCYCCCCCCLAAAEQAWRSLGAWRGFRLPAQVLHPRAVRTGRARSHDRPLALGSLTSKAWLTTTACHLTLILSFCLFVRRARVKVQKRPLHNTDGDLRKKSMAELYTLCLEAGCVLFACS
jgi:hypothetical protein